MQTMLAATFVANNSTNDLLVCSSTDGVKWSANTPIGQSSKNASSMVLFNFQFWLAFVANASSNDLLICTSADGVHWSGATPEASNTPVGQSSKNSPSMALFKKQLWLAFVANNPSNDLLICFSPDGAHWSANKQVGQSSTQAPSLAVFNNKLWMAFVANNPTNDLLICSSADGDTWSGNTQVGQSTKSAPSLAVFDNKLWLAFIANNDTNDVLVCSSADGVTWSANTQVKQSSKTAPSLAVFDNKLYLSFIANNDTNQVLVCTSSDGVTWSANTQMGVGTQLQSSSHAPTLTPVELVTGAVYPRYQILTLVYAPPGTTGGSSKSSVTYTGTTTNGTVNTITKSLNNTVSLTASLGSGGGSDGSGSGGSGSGTGTGGSGAGGSGTGASAGISFSLTEADTSAIAVTETDSFSNQIFGNNADGIDHGFDTFYLWLNPQLNFQVDQNGNVQWSMGVSGNGEVFAPSVLVSELQNPSTMRQDLYETLTGPPPKGYGLTETDFAQILATNPFAASPNPPIAVLNPNAAIDPNRYLPVPNGFNYEPPAAGQQPDPDPQVETLTNQVTNTSTTATTVQYSVTVKASDTILGALNLAVSDQLTYSIENSLATTSGTTASAVATIGAPSSSYTGPIDLLTYWDTVFHTFLFAFPEPGIPVIAAGSIVDNLGQPVANTPMTLSAGQLTFNNFTGPTGDYRFYGAPTGQGTLTVKGQKFPVQVGPNVPKQVLKLVSGASAVAEVRAVLGP